MPPVCQFLRQTPFRCQWKAKTCVFAVWCVLGCLKICSYDNLTRWHHFGFWREGRPWQRPRRSMRPREPWPMPRPGKGADRADERLAVGCLGIFRFSDSSPVLFFGCFEAWQRSTWQACDLSILRDLAM